MQIFEGLPQDFGLAINHGAGLGGQVTGHVIRRPGHGKQPRHRLDGGAGINRLIDQLQAAGTAT